MEAAMEEFAERGVELASYNKIIERSGLSKGTVYYYFDNKDSLLLTVLDEICERFGNAIGNLGLPKTKEEYWETAWEYHSRVIRFFVENPLWGRVLFGLFKDVPWSEGYLEAFHDRTTRFLDDLIARGQEIGAVRGDFPPKTVQHLMHTVAKVLCADILGHYGLSGGEFPDGKQANMEKFMFMIHDLSRRILTPEEDLICCRHF
jgi:AcrR family transcriptional regulator